MKWCVSNLEEPVHDIRSHEESYVEADEKDDGKILQIQHFSGLNIAQPDEGLPTETAYDHRSGQTKNFNFNHISVQDERLNIPKGIALL